MHVLHRVTNDFALLSSECRTMFLMCLKWGNINPTLIKTLIFIHTKVWYKCYMLTLVIYWVMKAMVSLSEAEGHNRCSVLSGGFTAMQQRTGESLRQGVDGDGTVPVLWASPNSGSFSMHSKRFPLRS